MSPLDNPTLLGLPVELRLKIFKTCMVIGIADIGRAHDSPFHKSFASLQIFTVCKQGLTILCGDNVVYLGGKADHSLNQAMIHLSALRGPTAWYVPEIVFGSLLY